VIIKYRSEIASVVLIAGAVGAMGYLWFFDRGRVTDTERQARAADVFPAFRKGDVTRIVLTRGDEQLVLERVAASDAGGGGWVMRAPRDEPAETGAVEALLQELETATRVRKVDGAEGFDTPRATGSIAMGRVTYTLTLGGAAPTPKGSAYMRLEGEGAFVVPASLAEALLRPADAFRIRQLTPYGIADARSVEVRAPGGTFAIERADAGDFRIVGSGLRVAHVAVDKLTSAIAEARADTFLADARLPAGPRTVVSLEPLEPSATRVELSVGGVCPTDSHDVVAVRTSPAPQVAACVASGIIDALGTSAAIDPRLIYATPDDVAELSVATLPTGASMDLARADNGWHQRLPEDRTLDGDDAEAATSFVTSLVSAAGEPRGKGDLPAPPKFRITIVRAQDRATEIVEVAVAADGTATARRAEDGALIALSASVAQTLAPRPTALRSLTLFPSDLRSMEIRSLATSCGGVTQELEHGDAGWSMRSPAGYAPDIARAIDAVDAIEHARAESWITDGAPFGFDETKCSLSAVLGADGGGRRVGIVFGREARGGIYAHLEGDANVFVAPTSLRDVASRWMIDRSGFAIDVGRAREIDLDGHGHHVTLLRRGEGFVLGSDGEADAALLDAVGEITAADVVHLGPAKGDEGVTAPALVVKVYGAGDAGGDRTLTFGATKSGSAARMFARISGVDATFVVDARVVDRVIEALP
jgi:Domain of unknown function (DUF4340)